MGARAVTRDGSRTEREISEPRVRPVAMPAELAERPVEDIRPLVEAERAAGVAARAPAGLSLPLDVVKIGTRHRRDMGDIDSLARSIADVGLLHPVVVRPDGMLIAGARRIAACRRLGWSEVPVRIMETPDP
jgi:hypothetical protein